MTPTDVASIGALPVKILISHMVGHFLFLPNNIFPCYAYNIANFFSPQVPGLLNLRPETMKLLEDKVREMLQEIGAGKSFLNGTHHWEGSTDQH